MFTDSILKALEQSCVTDYGVFNLVKQFWYKAKALLKNSINQSENVIKKVNFVLHN